MGTTLIEDIEAELAAIKTLVQTLEPLKAEVRARVIDHAFKVLGIELPQSLAHPGVPTLGQSTQLRAAQEPKTHVPTDIHSLKEQKAPKTATQMVAIVAYYLAHVAGERQNFITAEDIEKYFLQGRYPMPGSTPQALVHAKNAGYLDHVEPGKYRLNSVGFNLVEHKMPKDGAASSKPKGKGTKKSVKKKKK